MKITIRILLLTALFWTSQALALNSSDVGTYAMVHVDGHVTDKQFRLLRSEKGWSVEERQEDGSWQDVTCSAECAMVESKPKDVKRFLGADMLKIVTAECIHDISFAICRTSPKTDPDSREYLFVALTQKQPIVLHMKRVPMDSTWRDNSGTEVPNSESRGTANGLAGMLLLTPDVDWEQKWDTPSDTAPNFGRASVIPKGTKVFLLVFISNPLLSGDGKADVTCDIDILQPDGKVSSHDSDLACLQTEIGGNPTNLYLAAPVIGFSGDPEDPVGQWTFQVTLKDNHRHVELPLKTALTLQ